MVGLSFPAVVTWTDRIAGFNLLSGRIYGELGATSAECIAMRKLTATKETGVGQADATGYRSGVANGNGGA